MAGTVREARLGTRTSRSRLKRGRMPHWQTLVAGRAHLGYQRWEADRCGRWLLRRRIGDTYTVTAIGIADDDQAADGTTILDHEQARARAADMATAGERPTGNLTVRRAIADYLDHLTHAGRDARAAETVAGAHILPALGNVAVADITAERLRRWLLDLSNAPARLRTSRRGHVQQRYMPPPADDEAVRRRRASANRILTVLKAALNHAHAEGRVANADAWGDRVRPFGGVVGARTRYLTTDEANRLIAVCEPPAFRALVRAALETGCRYSELARMVAADFNPDSGTVLVRRSKSGKGRHVVLTPEGAAFFAGIVRDADNASALMLPRADGAPWRATNQTRPMAAACLRAGIDPIGFHALRHTWASLSAMAGVPLAVISSNLGHADLRMVQRHYAHLSASFTRDAIRTGAPRFGRPP